MLFSTQDTVLVGYRLSLSVSSSTKGSTVYSCGDRLLVTLPLAIPRIMDVSQEVAVAKLAVTKVQARSYSDRLRRFTTSQGGKSYPLNKGLIIGRRRE